jgi:thiol-disulfide isomerase/thioredoxin
MSMNKVKAFISMTAISLSLSSCFLSGNTQKENDNKGGDGTEVTTDGNKETDVSNLPVAKDFTLDDMKGNKVSLMKVVSESKITILDFWASWCPPCMNEMPNLVNIYDNYSDDGLQIVGVSLDNDKKSWQNAVEAMGMKWVQVSDLKGWESAAAQLYQVDAIPHTIILDKEGHILAKDLRGHELEEFISDYIE